MKFLRYLFIFFIVFNAINSQAYATETDWVQACDSSAPMFDKNCRKILAMAIYKNHTEASNLLPALSPKEIEWVEQETADMGQEKYMRAVQSLEYAIYKIRGQLEQSAEGASYIANNDLSLTHELYIWVQIFSTLNEFEAYYPDKLLQAGVINQSKFAQALGRTTKSCDSSSKTGGNSFGDCLEVDIKHLMSQAILRKIVIPGLAALQQQEAASKASP